MLNVIMSIKGKLIAAAVAVLCVAIGCWFLYNKGYNAGVDYVNSQVQSQRDSWIAEVQQLQSQHDKQVIELQTKYKTDIQQLNKQITTLKNNPKIIEKYIPEYIGVPSTFVLLHDRCALGQPLDTMIIDSALNPQNYTLTDVGNTIAYNYNICNQCITKLTTLQTIVKQYIDKQQRLIKNE